LWGVCSLLLLFRQNRLACARHMQAPILADKNVRLHVARAGEPILPEE